jgi:ABC-type branched-subunit amino acid transport system substrate-binding protein
VVGAGLSATSASGATTKSTEAPILIGTQALVNTPIGSYPQVFAGVKAAALAINRGGGIHGHRIEVLTCNGQNDPNAEVRCAGNAVSSGVVAEVGDIEVANPGGVENALESGNTADLGAYAFAPQQYSSPIAFPLTFLEATEIPCATKTLASTVGANAKFVTLASTLPSSAASTGLWNIALAKEGLASAAPVVVGPTVADLSPAAAAVANGGANIVFINTLPTQITSFIASAVATRHSYTYCAPDGTLPGSDFVQLGGKIPKFYQGTVYPPPSAASKFPELQKFISQMKAEQKAGDSPASLSASNYNTVILNAWLGMQAFDQVASSMTGPINHTTFLATLGTSSVKNLGIVPTLDFDHSISSSPLFKRVFSDTVYLERWNVAKKEMILVPGGAVPNSLQILGL